MIDTLITACLRGDRSAQRELFGILAPRAFRVAVRYVTQRASAEDVVQEALSRVFDRLGDFDANQGDFGGWTHRIFVNESLRYLRRHGKLVIAEAPPPETTWPTPSR